MPTIAEILHRAADKHLEMSIKHLEIFDKVKFSCDAIHCASDSDETYFRISEGLKNMGCPVNSVYAFEQLGYTNDSEVRFDTEAQGARYIWLKFAALMAEEQGV